MVGALLILAFTIVVGVGLYFGELRWRRRNNVEQVAAEDSPETELSAGKVESDSEECCGQHLVCEKTHAAAMTAEIVYYDDEELDRYSGREADSYDASETEEFRDVLLTLLPEDVAGWAHSLDLRKIALPLELRDELLMLLAEDNAPIRI